MISNRSDSEIRELQEAFRLLTRSTNTLEEAYSTLKTQTNRLNLDLEESRNFLLDMVTSLNCGVLVTDLEGKIIMKNPEAIRLNTDNEPLVREWTGSADKTGTSNQLKKQKISWDAPDGKKLAISVSSLRRGVEGGKAGYILIIEDVTEVVRLRKQANRSERLAAIGQVAAGMAHEIRNPLGGMELYASLLGRDLKGDENKLKMVKRISAGIQAVNNVVSNTLLFTREPIPAMREFDMKTILEDIMEFAGYVFDQNHIKVKTRLPKEPILMKGDPDLLRQVILNLIHNSVQAMPGSGEFFISGISVEKNKKPFVEIVTRDTGSGIPDNIRDKVFDPFFTTKDSGSGLGLAIASQITQAHGGYIDLIDTAKKGAGFIICLPRGDF
ncbi:hypothetical protein MNBD_NITROSPINAE01-138 [hydrothermal vent metagenome]|uniref:Histidine kinase domain-containing protein n=1 Tax=hydrothermal vent metagenome TaxID=652676 RepID=A0A3B1CK77_9ZZZZ